MLAALLAPGDRALHATANRRRRFRTRPLRQGLKRLRRHLDVQVDAIQQRA